LHISAPFYRYFSPSLPVTTTRALLDDFRQRELLEFEQQQAIANGKVSAHA